MNTSVIETSRLTLCDSITKWFGQTFVDSWISWQNRHHEGRIGEFYNSTGNKNSRKKKMENFWILILVWIKYCILVAILWSDIFIHDLISQIEHFCYWNSSAKFVRQYYKMIWANFCWQLYIMGKIDIMKSVSESFTVLQGTKIHEKGNWKISEFLFSCE